MKTLSEDKLNDLIESVRGILCRKLGDEIVFEWGMQVDDWVKDYVNEGDTGARKIAKSIASDYYNSI